MPDRDFLRFPSFHRPDCDRLCGYHGNVSTPTGPCVLSNRKGMKIDYTSSELAVLLRRRRSIGVDAFSWKRVIEGPMLYVPLTSLHHRAAYAGVPTLAKGAGVCLRKMKICIR